MQNQFYNQPVVNWAKQNLQQPLEIRVKFSSPLGKIFMYLLVFFVPLLFVVLGLVTLILSGSFKEASRSFACAGVLMIPCLAILFAGILTRQKFVKSLDASGVKASMGRRFLWENLYYIDHVSKTTRVGNVSRKTEDNQLELVFADGKAIIPPLIDDRERIWNFINSIPAQVKFDGEIKTVQSQNAAADVSAENFMRELERLVAQDKRNQ